MSGKHLRVRPLLTDVRVALNVNVGADVRLGLAYNVSPPSPFTFKSPLLRYSLTRAAGVLVVVRRSCCSPCCTSFTPHSVSLEIQNKAKMENGTLRSKNIFYIEQEFCQDE